MEAARIGLGPNNLHLLCNTNKLSLFPRRLLQHNAFSSKNPLKHGLSLRVRATTESSSGDLESTRPLANFPPSFWGDYFLSVHVDESKFDALATEIESVMQPKVRVRLLSPDSGDKEKIRLIHLLISLGIAHYYENEIEEILDHAFKNLDALIKDECDLETIAIMFEVFRLYRHKMSCDAFDRFKGEDGRLKESLGTDIRGMLQLYEAAHLRASSEDIMEEALSFTRNHLESLAKSASPHLSKHIQKQLYIPRYLCSEIVVAREYISFYEQEEGHDETLLKFAKLNFNFCQLTYVKELKDITKWWSDLDFATKLPFVRNRCVEIYLAGLALYVEPRYSVGRVYAAKLTMLLTCVDDICDAYATVPEVASLVDAFQRWDLSTIEELPSYMRIIYREVLGYVEEIDREMRARGRSQSVQPTIDECKSLVIAYLEIAKWARAGHVPSFDEYMKVGLLTAGMDDLAAYGYIAMHDDCDEKQLIEWFYSKPKIIQALSSYFRIQNDIASFEVEMGRGEVANGVNCYMKQYGVTKEEAVEEMGKMAEESYKIMMNEFMVSNITMPRQIVVRIINIARVIAVYYREGEGFTYPDGTLKDRLASLFIKPIPL
ncbi:hypothetical protein HID58_068224 [Brassica napus]|uniref:(+)-delta-cadinene synthase n=4 Tax=Brassica TaxID=3705 RepID=A0ABQ7F573_BRACR|nr:terpenoid synthase 25 [Brassica napus]KAF3611151.1 hypothetical protein DY000_02050591 [Brassica cretica]KAG2271977.1 hypothetical protein Bca52824_066532 [Brassica carinata]KAH0880830.1 hypothetical protein HID58_068224 [Brassica napus]CAF1934666.1 unnamed protein product [Brassica napus]